MKVSVDDELCRGHAVCVSLCPEVFTLADDGYAVAPDTDVAPELEETVLSAVRRCPERAITTGSG